MNHTAQTVAQTSQLAKDIAAANAFDYAGNFGKGTFRYQVQVVVVGNRINLIAECNAQINEDRARSELAKLWAALVDATTSAGIAANLSVPLQKGRKLWRVGFWNMGVFCTTGLARGVRAK